MNFKIYTVICFSSLLLIGLLFSSYPHQLTSIAAPAITTVSQEISPEKVDSLGEYDVIYLGENHDRAEHHTAQLEIISHLHRNSRDLQTELAIGWEMFQRPFQPMLDRYVAGTISESDLRKQTEYDQRWGFDWEFYAPILRLAQENKIPLIALNTPEEITRKVAEDGLDSLQGSDFRYIPSKTEIDFNNPEYRQKMADIYQSHLEAGEGNSRDQDNFFAAQVLWDETMADAIASYYQNYSQSQIVVLVGKAHVMDDYAIPNRVARRITDKSFTQTSLLLDN